MKSQTENLSKGMPRPLENVQNHDDGAGSLPLETKRDAFALSSEARQKQGRAVL
jgi:hypothetical protein